ncbi:MAG: DUF6120 family protein [Eubacterium sp.]|nr:DUF6120 family protein [uncultured Eubacterium sp.]
MNKLCKTYIRRVKTLFPLMGKSERKYIKILKTNINDYLVDTPNSNINDLYKEFGSPKDIMNSYYSTIDIDNVIKKIRISKYVKTLIILLAMCLLSLTVLRFYIQYEGHQVFMKEQIHSEETIIE